MEKAFDRIIGAPKIFAMSCLAMERESTSERCWLCSRILENSRGSGPDARIRREFGLEGHRHGPALGAREHRSFRR